MAFLSNHSKHAKNLFVFSSVFFSFFAVFFSVSFQFSCCLFCFRWMVPCSVPGPMGPGKTREIIQISKNAHVIYVVYKTTAVNHVQSNQRFWWPFCGCGKVSRVGCWTIDGSSFCKSFCHHHHHLQQHQQPPDSIRHSTFLPLMRPPLAYLMQPVTCCDIPGSVN